jgi:hypothetical protein
LEKHICDAHGELPWSACDKCNAELCAHGKRLTQHCDECNADQSWATAPITDDELARIKQVVGWGSSGPFRLPTTPRNYHFVSLLPKLLLEYEQLRAKKD